MNVIVVGCGNIGLKRIKAIENISDIEVVCLIETNVKQAEYLKEEYNFPVTDDYK